MAEGWISLHRKLLSNPIAGNPESFALWVRLLLMASHTDTDILVGRQSVHLKRGQLVTGRKILSELTGIPESNVEYNIKLYERLGQIQQQTTNKYRIITIINYDSYQETNSRKTADGQQMDTNNKNNNVNNVNNTNHIVTTKHKVSRNHKETPTTNVVEQALVKPEEYGNSEINKLMGLLKELSGGNIPKDRLNRFAANRLLKRYGADKVEKALRFGFMMRGEQFCPQVYNYMDLEEKWQKLLQFAISARGNAESKKGKVVVYEP
jgi:hypothetical protein